MLRMQIQNSPQSQQVQVVQSQPQIIQVRYLKYFIFVIIKLILKCFFFKVSSQANGPTPVYISQPNINSSSSPE